MSEGSDAIRAYFAPLQGSGNKNAIGERRTLVLSDNAVLVTGFYEFTRVKEGKTVPAPARFTMLLIKHDGEWSISHHILHHAFDDKQEQHRGQGNSPGQHSY